MLHRSLLVVSSFVLLILPNTVLTQTYSCDASNPCSNGACCGASGYCGYGDAYCGTGCQSNCNAHAECGINAAVPNTICPLNVCCSQYGFCGTTSDFCETGCQSGCDAGASPSCSGGNSATNRVIGYYESWATSRPCSAWYPEQLNPYGYTHINFAFASIDGNSYSIVPASPTDTDLYTRTTALKSINPDLKVFISVGGWSFNDPPTQNIFSDLAASPANRQSFITSLLSFFQQYGFDGVDIDWEYPAASDRGGVPADTENYVTLLSELRTAFDSTSAKYGLTITIPSSYWYLQDFDIVGAEQYVDWFNAMEYDLHGTWDGTDPYIGAVVLAHSNLTEIDESFDLLWRNNIDPSKVVMGLGFYGRSFQLSDPSCTAPGCPFAGPANAGPCTASPGTLSYQEIQSVISSTGVTPTWDQTDAVKYIVWDSDQWVSYDDADTFKQKLDYANGKCVGGIMVWSADQDDATGSALTALVGSSPQFQELSQKSTLAAAQSFNTGQICSVTDCGQTCGPGYTALSTTKGKPTQPTYQCGKGQSREVCCPSSAVPTGCTWRGTAPFCDGLCHDGEVEITKDKSGSGASCWTGTKALCCPATTNQDVLNQCTWFGTAPFCDGKCPSTSTPNQVTTGGGGSGNGAYCFTGHKALCCPNPSPYENCQWYGTAPFCNGQCPAKGATGAPQVQLYSDNSGDGHLCLTGSKVYCCDAPNAVVEPAVVQYENYLSAFAQSPSCDVSDELFDRRALPTYARPDEAAHDADLQARDVASADTINNLVTTTLALLMAWNAYNASPNAPFGAAQLGMLDAFDNVSPGTFGGAGFDSMGLRLQLSQAQSSVDPRSEVQDMFCEGPDLLDDTLDLLTASYSLCYASATSSCSALSSCPGSSSRHKRYHSAHHYEKLGHSRASFYQDMERKQLGGRYFDQESRKAGKSSTTNNVRPNVYDVITAIVNGQLPILEYSVFDSGAPTKPADIQIEVIFDIRGQLNIAEFPAAFTTSQFSLTRQGDTMLVLHLHLADPSTVCGGPPYTVNIKAMNIWHGQVARTGANSPAVTYIEVAGQDKRKQPPDSWGANKRFHLLECGTGEFWPASACPFPVVQFPPGIKSPTQAANSNRANLVGQLIAWLTQEGILNWTGFVDFMWDYSTGTWYHDSNHRRGPRRGPGGGSSNLGSIGVS